MLPHLLALLSLAQAAPAPETPPNPPTIQAAQSTPNPFALAQYNAKRQKTPRTADAQWRLALWCEDHELDAEAKAALAVVVELDPSRDAAWKRLGCEKYHGQWMTPEQIDQAKVQDAADKRWAAEFKAIHHHIHGGKRQDEARAALARVDDPRAVPALYREFANRSSTDQTIAVQVLGQIPGPVSSKTLASLSIYGVSTEVRRLATETLRGRDPSEYAPFLVGLFAKALRYEVRPVAGPGSPGILYVEGEKFNLRRFYAPPPAPNVTLRPGDMIAYDNFGCPIIRHNAGILATLPNKKLFPGEVVIGKPAGLALIDEVDISPRLLQMEAVRGAAAAQSQLQGDVAWIESQNQARNSFNGIVARVLKDATGETIGEDPEAWKSFSDRLAGYDRNPDTKPRPTINQNVALAYQPRFRPAFESVGFLRLTSKDG